jgi:hypothetical protein
VSDGFYFAVPVYIVFAIIVVVWVFRVAHTFVRWKVYIWLPSIQAQRRLRPPASHHEKHLVFVMVDHYEPGVGAAGVTTNDEWLAAFRPIANAHRDSFGNCFRYSWFYPYDHKNEGVLIQLCRMAYEGLGEVELHWHHPPANNETFPGMLKEALGWFQQYGAMVSSGVDPQTHFAFIHGNWALNNSLPICGVSREVDILFQHGCYADFTFPTIGSIAQPRKVNSIYYARHTEGRESYASGDDVRVGAPVDDRLMMFQGPMHFHWLSGRLEYSAVESFALPTSRRIREWIDTHIHVLGRPEWTFVKVYSHGIQSATKVVHRSLGPMLDTLQTVCREKNCTLHYMTAREAYNVAKAAEAGMTGNPSEYRDFHVPRPRNMLFRSGNASKPASVSVKCDPDRSV